MQITLEIKAKVLISKTCDDCFLIFLQLAVNCSPSKSCFQNAVEVYAQRIFMSNKKYLKLC